MKPCLSRRKFLAASTAMAVAPKLAGAAIEPVKEFRRGGMVYRQLGNSDLYISLLSFGSHTRRHGRLAAPCATAF